MGCSCRTIITTCFILVPTFTTTLTLAQSSNPQQDYVELGKKYEIKCYDTGDSYFGIDNFERAVVSEITIDENGKEKKNYSN